MPAWRCRPWARLPGPIGDQLRAFPQRIEGDKRNRAEFDRVRDGYSKKPGSDSVRPHWYPGTLRDLAQSLGRDAEYDAFYGLYSAWAHGDPWTSSLLELGNGGLVQAYAYWAQIMIKVAEAKHIILTGDAYQSLEALARGMMSE